MQYHASVFFRAFLIAMTLPLALCGCAAHAPAAQTPSDPSEGKNSRPQLGAGESIQGESAPNSSAASSSDQGTQSTKPTKKAVPYLVKPTFAVTDSIVAAEDIVNYGADPTGRSDSTEAIRAALNAVHQSGGGTVWCPKGTYLVTQSIYIPPLCTLRGDWNDPDAKDFNGDHGTVILAKPETSAAENTGLFNIAECAGLYGLTVYYPEQDVKNVKPYAPTVFMGGSLRLRTVKNVTLINSYTGLYVQGINESTNLFNVKGTCLHKGMEVHSSGDVGVFDGVTFAPDYWANAGKGMKKADRAAIVKYCKDNKTPAMLLHDLEQQQFSRITIKGYEYGILFSSERTRFMASGPMYQVKISDCTYGIYAQGGTYLSSNGYAANICPVLTSIDWRCGYLISNSEIGGSKYSIYNGCPAVTAPDGKKYTAYIHLTDVKLDGATYGNVSYTAKGKSVKLNDMKDAGKTKTTGTAFEAVKSGASRNVIQRALNKVGNAGGGVVYLPAGNYEIEAGLTVPKNTELVGAAALPQRIPNKGTVLWCRQPSGNVAEMRTAKAMVTLNGDNSGISGVYFMYDQGILAIDAGRSALLFPFALRGKGKGVWAVNCCIAGASYGIDFTNCDNHLIQSLFSGCIFSHMEVSGNNGMIRNCLANGTVMFRLNGVLNVNEGANMFPHYFNKYGLAHTEYITVRGGSGEQTYNNFIFGGRHLLYNRGGQNVFGVNMCSDNLGTYVLEQERGSLTIANAIITSVKTFHNQAGSFAVYNPLRNNHPDFADYVSEV